MMRLEPRNSTAVVVVVEAKCRLEYHVVTAVLRRTHLQDYMHSLDYSLQDSKR